MSTIDTLKELSARIYDLQCIGSLLAWDQEVYMPHGAVQDRANQLALLSGILHEYQIAKDLNEALERAASEQEGYSVQDKALVRVMKRNYEQSTKLPAEFVTEFSKLTSQSVGAWVEARKKSDFSAFAPFLTKIVAMVRKQTEYLGYEKHPYDALLDLYEEDLTTADVTRVFEEIKQPLIELTAQARQHWQDGIHFDDTLHEPHQKSYAHYLLEQIGYDFNRGRMDNAPHPFMERFGHNDRRVTNRYNPHAVEFIFGALHEGGHALYEQGISVDLSRTALDTGVSLGIHESQSRMWENMIGRNRAFWDCHYDSLVKEFPKQFGHIPVGDFYRRINQVKPGLIRVDADEVTYNLHVLIRFEIEKALIEGSLEVPELPTVWNAKYKEYLGVEVPDDAHGVLQDIHWSHGGIGYFPTYTLGNLNAAQIWNTYKHVDKDVNGTIRSGNTAKIKDWLTEHIYKHGSVYTPKELMKRVTGEEVQSTYLLEYLREKYLHH